MKLAEVLWKSNFCRIQALPVRFIKYDHSKFYYFENKFYFILGARICCDYKGKFESEDHEMLVIVNHDDSRQYSTKMTYWT